MKMTVVLLAIALVATVISYRNYKSSSYYRITKASPIQLFCDKGKLGEYLTYKHRVVKL